MKITTLMMNQKNHFKRHISILEIAIIKPTIDLYFKEKGEAPYVYFNSNLFLSHP